MSIWNHLARLLLFIADHRDPLIEGGQTPQLLGPCDAGHRAKGKPYLAGDLPQGLAGPAQGFNLARRFGRDPCPRTVRPLCETRRAFVPEAPQLLINVPGWGS
jgi:hypothetical protein